MPCEGQAELRSALRDGGGQEQSGAEEESGGAGPGAAQGLGRVGRMGPAQLHFPAAEGQARSGRRRASIVSRSLMLGGNVYTYSFLGVAIGIGFVMLHFKESVKERRWLPTDGRRMHFKLIFVMWLLLVNVKVRKNGRPPPPPS